MCIFIRGLWFGGRKEACSFNDRPVRCESKLGVMNQAIGGYPMLGFLGQNEIFSATK